MVPLHPEFVVDDKNAKKAVIIPYSEWEQLMEELEELEEIRAYDQAKREPADVVPFEDAIRELQSGEDC